MSSNYFDADWTDKVTLPVKRVGAHWEFFYGGDVPVREGTLAELTLDERCELQASTVLMPEGFKEPAISLNHAFTMLSELYEGHRISHTGNVYTRVFYCEGNGNWFPLNDLLRGVLVTAERNLLKSAWDEVEKALGWRPTPPQPKNSKKSTKK